MPSASLIVQGRLDSPLAWLSKPLNGLPVDETGQEVSRSQFLTHVIALAEHLPDKSHALNLCDNRYLFLVAAWAVILREQTNLLPPNKNATTQHQLSQRYEYSYAIHDGLSELDERIHALDISGLDWSLRNFDGHVPSITLDHLAIISFTSGSTGESKPNLKTWRAIEQSSAINAVNMLPDSEQIFYHLATVPGQHMWGLETSVMLPVFANACLVDARPMFPKDIVDVLNRMPKPAALISTPLHLRALNTAYNDVPIAPKITNVLCATAPLNNGLAAQVESTFGATLREVYGCSEVGSMAVRRTAKTDAWRKFEGLNFTHDADGSTKVSASYLPAPVTLEDELQAVDGGKFKLAGRITDQIKIAGKRGSLSEVNAVLSRFDGALDGVVIFPEQDRLVPRLVALVVLQEGADKSNLRDHFREFVDAAFVPRPIYIVDSLPREENGKLAKDKLTKLYQSLSNI